MKKKGLDMEQKRSLIGWAFLLPATILIFIFCFYPMVQALILSFQKGMGSNVQPAGFANYARILKDATFQQCLFNTVFYFVIQVPIMLILALILAQLLNSPDPVAANWNAIDFDDSAWSTVKAADMGDHMATTVYIRREVNIPNLEDYHVLNVRVKYVGGIAAYFNGRLVARFNLAEGFDASTEAQTVHDSSFSKFHVILPMVGAVAGKNVMAFEVHRAPG